MRAVIDRFGDDLALVMVNDDIGHNSGLLISPKMFMQIFPDRMKRLIAPAKDHGLKVLMHTDGKLDGILPILYDVGIDANHPVEPESNDIVEVKKKWAGKMALIGNIQYDDFHSITREQMAAAVRAVLDECRGQRLILSPSAGPYEEHIPQRVIENYRVFMETGWEYGRTGA